MTKQEKTEEFMEEFKKLLKRYDITFELSIRFKQNGDQRTT